MEKCHELDPKKLIDEPVDSLYLLWIVKKLCVYIFVSETASEKINIIKCVYGVMDTLINIEKNDKSEFMAQLYKKFMQQGTELLNKYNNRKLLDCSLAIKAALTIMESDNEKWKDALVNTFKETQKTIKAMGVSVIKKRRKKSRKKSTVTRTQGSKYTAKTVFHQRKNTSSTQDDSDQTDQKESSYYLK